MPQILDLGPKRFVFVHLPPKKGEGHLRLHVDAARCQKVGVGTLVVTVLEVLGLDPAFAYQCRQAIIYLPQADTISRASSRLTGVGPCSQELQKLVPVFVGNHSLADPHDALFRLQLTVRYEISVTSMPLRLRNRERHLSCYVADEFVHATLKIQPGGIDYQLGIFGSLVGSAYACKLRQFSSARLGIQAFWVTSLAKS